MTADFWKTPSFELSTNDVTRITLFRISSRTIIDDQAWPKSFFDQVQDNIELDFEDTKFLLNHFNNLEAVGPARCHMPPWGFAAYGKNGLIFTVTMCFECNNAYTYTSKGKKLRAFNSESLNAKKLFNLFFNKLPLKDESK